MGNRFLRAGVEVDRYGRAVAYHICEDDFPFSGSGRWNGSRVNFPPGVRPCCIFRAGGGRADPWGQSVLQRNGTAEDARFPAGNTASVGHSEGDVCSDD
ncbi:capsid protein of prophage [Escherichia coli]|uniref:Capsid protein of prophage n=1 Tax=Escherichia coli TaxID=562 RepID=A0A376U799_ECOLX|nr:capsid protein of prophage [Escherichia coli]